MDHLRCYDFDKRLVITEQGCIGKVSGISRKGDVICLLYGCGVPVVLRKHDRGGYMLIGESYIHGIMNGEAWAQFEGSEPQMFSIH